MKLVSKDGGFAAATMVADEIRPLDGINLPGLFSLVAEKFRFPKAPTLEEARAGGAKFRGGFVVEGERQINITELGIFNDGFAISTTDTDDSRLVLHHLLDLLKVKFKFRDPITKPKWNYQSDLVVDFDTNVMEFLDPLSSVIESLEEEYEKAVGINQKFHFDILGFVTEHTPPAPQPQFYIQRRVGAPLGSKRYFSKAHIPTRAHIRLLEMLDSALGKKAKKRR
jgi:hypothetical protein